MSNAQCCIRLCSNDKCYDSGKDISYFNFPRDKQKQKRTPSLEYTICLEYIVYARPTSFQTQTGGMAGRSLARFTITRYEQ